MLDTMKLYLQEWRILPNASLTINAGNINYATGEAHQTHLFTDTTGRDVLGAYASYNADKLNFSIKPKAGNVYAHVTFSAPKRVSDDNYSPIKESQFNEVLEGVESELAENGIETNIQEARLSRIDTFKNIQTNEETMSYARLFGLLNANRAKDKSTHGATTWLMKNNSTQYCIYDKLEEMENTGHETNGLPKTLRFEHRCMKPAKVKGFFNNVTTVEELKRYGWGALCERTIKAWTDNFFKYSVDEVEYIPQSQIVNELSFFRMKYGSRFFSQYLKAYGAYHLAGASGGVDVVTSALEYMGYERLKIYRAKRDMRKAILDIEGAREEVGTSVTLAELYGELKYKMEKIEA